MSLILLLARCSHPLQCPRNPTSPYPWVVAWETLILMDNHQDSEATQCHIPSGVLPEG